MAGIFAEDISVNSLKVSTINDSPYPPSTPNLSAVLLQGNSAGNNNITNVNNIQLNTINGSIYPFSTSSYTPQFIDMTFVAGRFDTKGIVNKFGNRVQGQVDITWGTSNQNRVVTFGNLPSILLPHPVKIDFMTTPDFIELYWSVPIVGHFTLRPPDTAQYFPYPYYSGVLLSAGDTNSPNRAVFYIQKNNTNNAISLQAISDMFPYNDVYLAGRMTVVFNYLSTS